jgi:hypothetical protein
MTPYTPLSCYIPLRWKLILVGAVAIVVVVGIGLGIAVVIDWMVGRFN